MFIVILGVMDIKGIFWGRLDTEICKNPSGYVDDCYNSTLAVYQLENAKTFCNNETQCKLKAGKFSVADEEALCYCLSLKLAKLYYFT